MNKLYLYLDDIRTPIDAKWIIARNYSEFIKIINIYGLDNFETISLDHDLGENSKSGMDCAKFIIDISINNNILLPKIFIHSSNPIGSENMMSIINNYLKFNNLPQNCIQDKIPFTVNN